VLPHWFTSIKNHGGFLLQTPLSFRNVVLREHSSARPRNNARCKSLHLLTL
jgi:hypothetical protein